MTERPDADLILVTGMSGAGRSTALAVLEDLGYEAVDNLPLRFLPALAATVGQEDGMANGSADSVARLAIGIDVRTLDFEPRSLLSGIDDLTGRLGLNILTLFLDCRDEVLIRRFAETRRRHPLAGDRPVAAGLIVERRTIAPLSDRANLVIDTSDLSIWEFKDRLTALLGLRGRQGPTITCMSFAFRDGVPREADIVLDVRFLNNPHYDPELRPLTGLDAPVGKAIQQDPDFAGFFDDLIALLRRTLPRYVKEGKSYLTVAIGCTGGRHRSVFTVEALSERLAAMGLPVYRFHRDLPKDSRPTADREGTKGAKARVDAKDEEAQGEKEGP